MSLVLTNQLLMPPTFRWIQSLPTSSTCHCPTYQAPLDIPCGVFKYTQIFVSDNNTDNYWVLDTISPFKDTKQPARGKLIILEPIYPGNGSDSPWLGKTHIQVSTSFSLRLVLIHHHHQKVSQNIYWYDTFETLWYLPECLFLKCSVFIWPHRVSSSNHPEERLETKMETLEHK